MWRSLFAALLLASCGVDTQTYFTVRRAAFEDVVERVETCRPTGRVTADGLNFDDSPSDVSCANRAENIAALRLALRRNGFQSVSYGISNIDEARPNLRVIEIADRSTRCHIGVIYEFEPDPDGGRHIYNAFADEYERFPLTDPPHHWFCESIGF